MKYRTGFVSNSSSSSFIIYNKQNLSDEQIDLLKNHIENCENIMGYKPD